jgi:uncharacterized membrane protein
MVTSFFFVFILAIVLPSLLISPLYFTPVLTVKFLYAATLLFSVVYIQSIGSGVGFNGSHLLDVINTGPNLSFELSLGGLIASSSCIISPSSELETAKKNYSCHFIIINPFHNVEDPVSPRIT